MNGSKSFSMMQRPRRFTLIVVLVVLVLSLPQATSLSLVPHQFNSPLLQLGRTHSRSTLFMVSDGGMKKRRRRKQQPSGSTDTIGPITTRSTEGDDDDDEEEDNSDKNPDKELLLAELKAVASFRPTARDERKTELMNPSTSTSKTTAGIDIASVENPSIDLPDIKNVLQKKELKKMEEEQEKKMTRPKISRRDKEAFIRLLEEEPFADANDSFFEEEEYNVINALLGERAQSFLGIPPGPIQVGHFMGALVIILMAFVQYPGFPLTNLPTPTRDSLQGGLLATYSINAVLAVLASFKAAERGQPKILWVFKTLSVGGLAYDQLTQLPTLEEMKKEDERKKATQSKARKR